MKKLITSLFAISLLVSACGNPTASPGNVDEVIAEGDLVNMQQKRDQVRASYDSIGQVLNRLEMAIAESDPTRQYPLVTAYAVKDTTFSSFISIQGSVETAENVLIYPEYQGVLTRLHVRQGQQVSRGQLLATIDDGGLSSQLAQSETQYELARTTFERQERLWEQNIGSELQYLQAKSDKEAAESAVAQMRSQLGKTSIRAPFSGVIDEIITEQGQVVAPGSGAILRLVNLRDMYVKAAVPESYLDNISSGTKVGIRFPAINLITEGTVRGVGSYIHPGNRTFQIEVNVPNPDQKIKPNLMASLQISSYSSENAIIIPAGTIQENALGEKFVYVLEENGNSSHTAKAVRTKIETGQKSNGFVEVLNGLETSDIIVWEGALSVRDGAVVSVLE